MKSKILVWGSILFIFWSCATAPVPQQIVNSFKIDRAFDSVWVAVIETFSDLQLPILNMEKDSGLIVTDWIDFKGQDNNGYCDCGKLTWKKEETREGKFNIFVKKITEASCEIKINTMYRQIIINYGDKRDCVSTGKLEKEFYDLVLGKT